MKILWLLLFPALLFSGAVTLMNDSPYALRAMIRGADGTYLGEVNVAARHTSYWSDSYGQVGNTGIDKGFCYVPSYSQTPYVVYWLCDDGADFAVCDTVSTGATVTALSCSGARVCKVKKKAVAQARGSK